MSDKGDETVMSKLSHILNLKNTHPVKRIMELQSQEDLNAYAQHRTMFNSLLVQRMELVRPLGSVGSVQSRTSVGDQIAIDVSIASNARRMMVWSSRRAVPRTLHYDLRKQRQPRSFKAGMGPVRVPNPDPPLNACGCGRPLLRR